MFNRMKHSHFCTSQALAIVSRVLEKQRGIGKILEKPERDLIGIAGGKRLPYPAPPWPNDPSEF